MWLPDAPIYSRFHIMTRCAALRYMTIDSQFTFIQKHLTLNALETFTGRPITEEVKNNINHPCNAFNAQTDAHETFDKLAWGIEAVYEDGKVNNFLP